MPKYTIKGVPDTPLVRVYADGVYAQEFTSLYAAKCWIEHRQKMDKLDHADLWKDGDR